MRAVLTLKDGPAYRRDSFIEGLHACGYTIVDHIADPQKSDMFITWNRVGRNAELAAEFERKGGKVLIAENGYMGREWNSQVWYAMSIGQHNGAGKWPSTGGSRWRRYGFELTPYRDGTEIILLPQRGIGPMGVAMPRSWPAEAKKLYGGRTREHPGINVCKPLSEDLANAKSVVTWGSGAAIKAMAMGVPVFYDFTRWIGRNGASHVSAANFDNPQRPDRTAAFEDVFDAMWTLEEIRSGEAFEMLVRCV